MNMKLTQRQNDTLLSIEANFDKFVAENFGDICRALAKHVKILTELRDLQRRMDIKDTKPEHDTEEYAAFAVF